MKAVLGVVAATVATPLAIAAAFVLVRIAGLGWLADKEWSLVLVNVMVFSLFAAPIALVISVVAGLPIARHLAKRGRTSAAQFRFVGAVVGLIPFLAFDVYAVTGEVWGERLNESLWVAFGWLALGAWCGAWSAYAFWLATYRGSPSNFPFQPTGSAVTPPAKQASRQPSGG